MREKNSKSTCFVPLIVELDHLRLFRLCGKQRDISYDVEVTPKSRPIKHFKLLPFLYHFESLLLSLISMPAPIVSRDSIYEEVALLRLEVNQLSQFVQRLNHQNQSLSDELQRLNHQNHSLSDELQRLNHQSQSLSDEVQRLNHQNHSLSDENKKLKLRVDVLEGRVDRSDERQVLLAKLCASWRINSLPRSHSYSILISRDSDKTTLPRQNVRPSSANEEASDMRNFRTVVFASLTE